MLEMLILASFVLILGLITAVLYEKWIRKAKKKYLEAKATLDDLVFSFGRQFKKQEDELADSFRQIDLLFGKNAHVIEEFESLGKELKKVEKRIDPLPDLKKEIEKIEYLENRLREISSAKEELIQKMEDLEKRSLSMELPIEKVSSPIPIKREKALAHLNETELLILKFIAEEGEKTSSQVKERIGLSREHRARLLKKLYEEGYLERSAERIPFKYSLKEEMLGILKPTNQNREQ